MFNQVLLTRRRLGKRIIMSDTACKDDITNVAAPVKINCVVETRLEDWRWIAIPLRRTEHNRRAGPARLIARALYEYQHIHNGNQRRHAACGQAATAQQA